MIRTLSKDDGQPISQTEMQELAAAAEALALVYEKCGLTEMAVSASSNASWWRLQASKK